MKQRITYIVKDPVQGYDPSNLKVTKTSLTVAALDGAKEHHITLGMHELPDELRELLTGSHELYVRWGSDRPYEATAPYASRISPGLHVFFSPLKNQDAPPLCDHIRAVFGDDVKCDGVETSFTTPPILSGRFSHSASRQFYSYVASLQPLVDRLVREVCPTSDDFGCKSLAQGLLTADYVDLDYNSISHALILKAFWSTSPDSAWDETHHLSSRDGALEVGVLSNEKPDEDEELKYSGVLTQVGKDKEPSPVLFSFPARHHPLPSSSTFFTSFPPPTGLHPTLKITLPTASSAASPPLPHCALHTYLTIPSTLFIDRYPLNDPLFLRSNSLKALHALSGATDLEAPDYLTPAWGSAALFEVDTADAAIKGSSSFSFTIPLHLRYLPPAGNASRGLRPVHVPDPVLFWACPAEEYGKFPSSPFDRVNLGYDGLFGPKTVFFHFTPAASADGAHTAKLVRRLDVPVLDLDRSWYVELGTVIAVLFGAALVGLPLVKVLIREFGHRWTRFRGQDEVKKEK
ncbi:uncharacterized protein PV09_07694 [Verruconis gallopava]|uniref:Protein PBN1 n=1 Tax=Verruconis gallopava TaxID=253628 RepID=A0A0D2A1T4_9PEZI|nr:uncharacterized protein PV09_07694 [Verruconis gallopava]KIW00708.1 hypothetical protein PV09_07694 [Verruconis gallopava]